MKPFKPKLRGWALAVWGAGAFLLAACATFWLFGDTHRHGAIVAYLAFAAIGPNVLSMALGRRDRSAETGSIGP
jgi:hypothetical protein